MDGNADVGSTCVCDYKEASRLLPSVVHGSVNEYKIKIQWISEITKRWFPATGARVGLGQ